MAMGPGPAPGSFWVPGGTGAGVVFGFRSSMHSSFVLRCPTGVSVEAASMRGREARPTSIASRLRSGPVDAHSSGTAAPDQ